MHDQHMSVLSIRRLTKLKWNGARVIQHNRNVGRKFNRTKFVNLLKNRLTWSIGD